MDELEQSIDVVLGNMWGQLDKARNDIKKVVCEMVKSRDGFVLAKVPKCSILASVLSVISIYEKDTKVYEALLSLVFAALDERFQSVLHPSFVEIAKQISSDEFCILRRLYEKDQPYPLITLRVRFLASGGEAVLFRHFSLLHKDISGLSCCQANDIPVLLDNLDRLKLIDVCENRKITDDNQYQPLINDEFIVAKKESVKLKDGMEWKVHKTYFELTDFGRRFCKLCVCGDGVTDKSST